MFQHDFPETPIAYSAIVIMCVSWLDHYFGKPLEGALTKQCPKAAGDTHHLMFHRHLHKQNSYPTKTEEYKGAAKIFAAKQPDSLARTVTTSMIDRRY